MNTICQHALILNSHSFPNSSQIYLPLPLFASSVFSFLNSWLITVCAAYGVTHGAWFIFQGPYP